MLSDHVPYAILLIMFGSIFLFTVCLMVILLVANIFKRYGVQAPKKSKKDHLRLVK